MAMCAVEKKGQLPRFFFLPPPLSKLCVELNMLLSVTKCGWERLVMECWLLELGPPLMSAAFVGNEMKTPCCGTSTNTHATAPASPLYLPSCLRARHQHVLSIYSGASTLSCSLLSLYPAQTNDTTLNSQFFYFS